MFTGIITDIGIITSAETKSSGMRFSIKTSYKADSIDIGASISCSGACLTVIRKGYSDDDNTSWFSVDVSEESILRTTIENWAIGKKINLERALKIGDELGGHMVTGHVDGVAIVKYVELLQTPPLLAGGDKGGGDKKITFTVPEELSKFIAEKGSVTLNGVSLTVNDVIENDFCVNIIPHTLQNTTFGYINEGDNVNLEIDIIARYAARLLNTNHINSEK